MQEIYGAVPDDLFEAGFQPRYNVYPTSDMPVVRENREERQINFYRWGLIPGWAKEPSTTYSMINARAESLSEKPAFRDAFRYRRCVVPANGYYEWRQSSKGKTPFYFRPVQDELFSFAGLYEQWQKGGQSINSFTIITTEANQTTSPLHDRMPAILLPEEIDEWLDPGNEDTNSLQELLRPYPNDAIRYYQVSREVNNPRNDGAHLIEPEEDLFS